MNLINITRGESGHYFLQGELTFNSIDKNTVKALRIQLYEPTESVILDLEQITTLDSAGLALLIEWLKIAKIRNIKLQFTNIPEKLLAIARLGGFEETLLDSQSGS